MSHERVIARLDARLGDVHSASGATATEILARYGEAVTSPVELAKALKDDPDISTSTGYRRVAKELLADE